jgi:hypothetical protein
MRRKRWKGDEWSQCLVDQGMICRQTLSSATVVAVRRVVATLLVKSKRKELQAITRWEGAGLSIDAQLCK